MADYPAPAKINLHLGITGRAANGYHLLDTSFVYVDAFDVLHVEPADELQVSCSDAALNGADNLVHRVLEALKNRHGISAGLSVHVHKQLPSQAGLGGGSSDAATALLAANHLWSLRLSGMELAEFATPFGADIPCFLFGQASIATGIGEQLSPLEMPREEQHVVLAHPGVGLSTPEVFARFDAEHNLAPGELTPHGAGATMRAGLRGASAGMDELPFSPGENMLEEVAAAMCPQLAGLLSAMREWQPASWMSGSGTACVSLCDSGEQAEALAGHLKQSGVAAWTHSGHLLSRHPLHGSEVQPEDWGVAKR